MCKSATCANESARWPKLHLFAWAERDKIDRKITVAVFSSVPPSFIQVKCARTTSLFAANFYFRCYVDILDRIVIAAAQRARCWKTPGKQTQEDVWRRGQQNLPQATNTSPDVSHHPVWMWESLTSYRHRPKITAVPKERPPGAVCGTPSIFRRPAAFTRNDIWRGLQGQLKKIFKKGRRRVEVGRVRSLIFWSNICEDITWKDPQERAVGHPKILNHPK